MDVDGDSDPDLVVGYQDSGDRIFINDGFGNLTAPALERISQVGTSTNQVAAVDIDGDGDPDLVTASTFRDSPAQNQVHLNDGSGNYTDETLLRMPVDVSASEAVIPGDYDGDGDQDLVFGNRINGPGQNHYLENNGAGFFSFRTALRMPALFDDTFAGAGVDIDNDGDLDLIFGNEGQDRVLVNDGVGFFSDETLARYPLESDACRSLVVADVDLDGDPDLVVGNRAQNRLLLNDGSGVFSETPLANFPQVAGETHELAVVDIDQDGDPDLILGEDGRQRVYLNDGSGRFTDVSIDRITAIGFQTTGLVGADFDGDGDSDLIVGLGGRPGRDSLDGSPSLIYFGNQLRQLDTPWLLRTGQSFRWNLAARFGPDRPDDLVVLTVSPLSGFVDAGPLGQFHLDPASAIVLPAMVIPRSEGIVSLTLAIPSAPSLVGASLFSQSLFLTPEPLGVRLSNREEDVFLP